jgi:hypothetical protein
MIEKTKTTRVFAVLGPRPADIDLRSLIENEGAKADRVEVYQKPGGEWAATLFRLPGR